MNSASAVPQDIKHDPQQQWAMQPQGKSAKKQARDPGAPKRNLSAYLLYQNSMREQFKAQNPDMSFGQLSKYTSAMYSQLTPDEKAAWQARADSDKARYEHELANYSPPPGYDPRGDQISMVPKPKKGKTNKDSSAPKKNVSAYLHYQNAMRDQFTRENPGMSFGELSKHTSQMYKTLTPEERAQWDHYALQDKQRYEAEIAAYHPPPGFDSRGVLVHEDPSAAGGRNKRKRPRDPTLPKRNKGSFVVFAEQERPKIKSEFPEIKFTEMGVILGERWRALSQEEKEAFEAAARNDKDRYSHEMEDYNRQHQFGVQQPNYSMDSAQIASSMGDPMLQYYPQSAEL